ncbi:hypothetical protein SeMB42_g05945 [Synchytrium endobioticum]|uniref:Peptidase M16 N-terminal domain-containing protein n=1 Tax=Synchytrium endobioticum TaxID=286115 RepID=A0A507CN64_9FUNG|nr:hypothetical protein SeMB42_g05945 [Synchytrium endobioticum]
MVPTLCENDAGLPHTLEHLIFCGSTSIPQRGYLDCLASRCLSTGTNAYTTEDHTNYTLTCAGEDGMVEVLPIFLDHVINPTLRDNQFITEVYHIDGDAKSQGVVYCEMAGRECSEGDMVDLALRRLVFQGQTTYSYECGGLTPDIAKLTNEEIVQYHKKFYNLNNITAVICGQVNPQRVFDRLTSMPSIVNCLKNNTISQRFHVDLPRVSLDGAKLVSQLVRFPSSDEQVGSITYAWRGPPSDDTQALLALDVLFRYLQDTAASPFAQKFVELENPYASDVDFDLRCYIQSVLVLSFNGVPYKADVDESCYETDQSSLDTDAESTDEDDEENEPEDDDREEDETEVSEGGDGRRSDLFDEAVFFNMMIEVLKDFVGDGFPSMDTMKATILRHRRKLLESLEDDPHEWIMERLVRDLVRFKFGSLPASDAAANGYKSKKIVGDFVTIIDMLDDLQTKPPEFWKTLVSTYLLNNTCFEIMALPDPQQAEEHVEREGLDRKRRAEELGPDNLKKLKLKVDEAIKENLPILSDELKISMPPIPDVSKAPKLSVESKILSKTESEPFGAIQIVTTETAFVHVRLGVDTSGLPVILKPFLVLFQELLFQTPILDVHQSGRAATKKNRSGKDGKCSNLIDYRDVAKRTSELFVSHEGSIGFGNDVFHTSWLSEVFSVYGCAEREEWEKAMRWLCQVLTQSVFTEDRVVSVAKNLISEIAETKRDGYSMAVALMTRVTCPLSSTNIRIPGKNIGKPRDSNRTTPSTTRGNDLEISLFKQEAFLKNILSDFRGGRGETILGQLNRMRDYMRHAVSGIKSTAPDTPAHATSGFVHIGLPLRFSTSNVVSAAFTRIWREENQTAAYFFDKQSRSAPGAKRKTTRNGGAFAGEGLIELPPPPFPFPRQIYQLKNVSPEFKSVMVPIPGVTASYLFQVVPCDVMRPTDPVEKYAVMLMVELLSLTEGPLYTAVRGNGYAYGADLSLAIWNVTPEGFDEICSQFQIDTARAACAYRLCSAGATSASLISTTLRNAMRGYSDVEQDLYRVTREDLRQVAGVHLRKFLDANSRVTVLTTMPVSGPEPNRMVEDFAKAVTKEWAVEFNVRNINSFALP